mmetsp:Transcript_52536/g.153060  ORF Transcript_52536/g.153060 Transcript_52536/m.153060 type:complete len:309 (+) Transcript_52536:301-1227(+)
MAPFQAPPRAVTTLGPRAKAARGLGWARPAARAARSGPTARIGLWPWVVSRGAARIHGVAAAAKIGPPGPAKIGAEAKIGGVGAARTGAAPTTGAVVRLGAEARTGAVRVLRGRREKAKARPKRSATHVPSMANSERLHSCRRCLTALGSAKKGPNVKSLKLVVSRGPCADSSPKALAHAARRVLSPMPRRKSVPPFLRMQVRQLPEKPKISRSPWPLLAARAHGGAGKEPRASKAPWRPRCACSMAKCGACRACSNRRMARQTTCASLGMNAGNLLRVLRRARHHASFLPWAGVRSRIVLFCTTEGL